MKLFKIFSTTLAISMFETNVAAAGFNCKGVIFTSDHIVGVMNLVFVLQLGSIDGYPKPYMPSPRAKGCEGCLEFPLSDTVKIWRGGPVKYRAVFGPLRDTVNVFSDIDGGQECVSA